MNPETSPRQSAYPLDFPLAQTIDLERSFGATRALVNVNLDVRRGEILVVLGPSGCGKTTLLRCLAGLERPDAGEVRIDGDVVNGAKTFVAPEKRGVGMVFQSLALWPHLRVAEQVTFVLEGRGLSRGEIETRVRDGLASVGLAERARAYPHELSGGERQRIALVRALATHPRLLLLDEPLSDLDPGLREEIRDETAARVRRLGLTAVYVTHDQEEGLAIADRIAVMRAGRIEQVDTPDEIYRHPRDRFVAEFLGHGTVVRGTVSRNGVAQTVFGDVSFAGAALGEAWLALRPESLLAHRNGAGTSGVVTSRSLRAGRHIVRVDLGEFTAVAESDQAFKPGDTVRVRAVGDGVIVDE
ncbi:MAG: ABC transporter ATP-binding protein [Planctomycetes bacterium]|nr:ABC transporter ATP-binding protein [Planctomycetota bacterium]MBI3847783.1 ABC transporter ATP-binding protein [Planctomycetota bacterium]